MVCSTLQALGAVVSSIDPQVGWRWMGRLLLLLLLPLLRPDVHWCKAAKLQALGASLGPQAGLYVGVLCPACCRGFV